MNNMNKKLTRTRLILAVISTALEETTIWIIWRWVLPDFGLNLPVVFLVSVMTAWLIFSVWLFLFTTRVLRKQVQAGLPSMIGTRGKVTHKLNPEGTVKIRGELWSAAAESGVIEDGAEITVVAQDSLKLTVHKVNESPTKH
jgi:membrane-bound ClpP family serine protease